jgi:astacin
MVKKSKSKGERDLKKKWEWFRSSDETGRCFISGETFKNKEVEYSVIDDLAIFEGDICLGKVEEIVKEIPAAEAMESSARGVVLHGIGITGENFRWPRGLIPYEIAAGMPNQARTDINNAIAHWRQNTNIRFILRTTANASRYRNYVRFISGSGCWSYVGMRGNMQELSIGVGCRFGATVHEIGHAVGLWHEQSREDRNRHVRIHWNNIIPGREHNFNQHIADGDDIGPYDFGSIMHYGAFAFSRNGQRTIETLRGEQIGQRNGLSQGDITAVRALYPRLEPPPQTTRLFRYWGNSDHFYTTSWRELGSGRYGWKYEGVQCYIHPEPTTGTRPLFRYFNKKIVDHFYTTNWRELGAGRSGWRLEGIQGYVYPRRIRGTIPLYRYWNSKIGDHFYTTSWSELGQGKHGWRYEGVQCYVYPLPPARSDEEESEDEEVVSDFTSEGLSMDEGMMDEEKSFSPLSEEMDSFSSLEDSSDSFTVGEEELQKKYNRTLTLKLDLDKE